METTAETYATNNRLKFNELRVCVQCAVKW
jgi:hypothetical protein